MAAGGVVGGGVVLSEAGAAAAAGGVVLSGLAAVVAEFGVGFEGTAEFAGGCVAVAAGAAGVELGCDAGVAAGGAGAEESGVDESVWTAEGLLPDGLSQAKL